MICAAREHPMERESPAKGICAECFGNLPQFMQTKYRNGELTIRQIGSAARTRNTSYNEIRPRRSAQK